nr:SDR family oxidoreductase [Halovivax sp.]
MRFENSTVVVTGGGSGIGRETARAFAEEGGNVVVADVDREVGEDAAETITDETDGEATFVEVDVTDDGAVNSMVETAVEQYGGLDAAVNNAGIGGPQVLTAEVDDDGWQAVIDVNLTGVWRCMRHEIPAMVDDGGGAIVNVASILGRVGFETASAYTAAKHGVLGLTKTAALEYADDEIRVNAVCPGFVETPMLDEAGMLADEDVRRDIEGRHAMDRLGRPDEIADAITWLCSDGASFTTGESLVVDGGYLSQ